MTQNPPAVGAFCWSELGTTDAVKARAFYTSLFGWKMADQDMGELGTYTMLRVGGGDIGGMYSLAAPMFAGVPSHWMYYVAVDDVDAIAAKAGALGGKVVMPPMDIHDVGRMAVLEDPDGAKFALFKGGAHAGAAVDPMQPGAFCWVELHTRDPQRAEAFYSRLLGWRAKHSEASGPMEYTEWSLAGPGQPFGGMLRMQKEWGDMPPFWLGYVTVTDPDATANRARSLGARVLCPPTDIAGVGRFAVLMDPTGAVFAVIKLAMAPAPVQGSAATTKPAANAAPRKPAVKAKAGVVKNRAAAKPAKPAKAAAKRAAATPGTAKNRVAKGRAAKAAKKGVAKKGAAKKSAARKGAANKPAPRPARARKAAAAATKKGAKKSKP